MNKTTNYELIKPDGNEIYDIEQFNLNMDTVDEELNNLDENKADKSSLSSKADKVLGGKAGNIAVLTSDGGVADGELKFTVVNGGLRIIYDDGE